MNAILELILTVLWLYTIVIFAMVMLTLRVAFVEMDDPLVTNDNDVDEPVLTESSQEEKRQDVKDQEQVNSSSS